MHLPKKSHVEENSGHAAWPNFNAIPADRYVDQRQTLLNAYQAVRAHSGDLTTRFSEAEQQIQSMPDASPTKWHLAHTTWFFETFILEPFRPGFEWFDEHFCYLFNSYYNAIGSQYPRPQRGLIGKPGLNEVWAYRRRIDEDTQGLIERCDDGVFAALAPTLVLGLNHEQQHQELIQTDIKHGLFQTAEAPANGAAARTTDSAPNAEWLEFPGGAVEIGYSKDGFCFDNELARHQALLPPFRISSRLVTAGEWLEFMDDGGYEKPLLWLSDGWQWQRDNDVKAPLYWRSFDGCWHRFGIFCRSGALAANSAATTSGWIPIDPNEPVMNISYYEADAFAEWRGARLPRETEWEAIAASDRDENFQDTGKCWEWTQSAYSAYPGFKATAGHAGEYNGKFMVNQLVLRGSSSATPAFHSRPSYRNFFYPNARWQYSGLRLAQDRREGAAPTKVIAA